MHGCDLSDWRASSLRCGDEEASVVSMDGWEHTVHTWMHVHSVKAEKLLTVEQSHLLGFLVMLPLG